MSSLHIPEETFQCAVCLEELTDPRNLDCGHTFCLGCLENVTLKKKKVPCPTCRQETRLGNRKSVKELGIPTILKDLQQKSVRRQTEQFNCDACCAGISGNDHMCYTCRFFLCHSCWDAHKKFSTNHQGDLVKDISFCATHNKQPQNGKCQDCDVYICQLCRLGPHGGHTFIDMQQLVQDVLVDFEAITHGNYVNCTVEDIQAKLGVKSFRENVVKLRTILAGISEKITELESKFDANMATQITKFSSLVEQMKINENCSKQCAAFADTPPNNVKRLNKLQDTLSSFREIPDNEILKKHNLGGLDTARVVLSGLMNYLSLYVYEVRIPLKKVTTQSRGIQSKRQCCRDENGNIEVQTKKIKVEKDPENRHNGADNQGPVSFFAKGASISNQEDGKDIINIHVLGENSAGPSTAVKKSQQICQDAYVRRPNVKPGTTAVVPRIQQITDPLWKTSYDEVEDEVMINIRKTSVMGSCVIHDKRRLVLRTNDTRRAIIVCNFQGHLIQALPAQYHNSQIGTDQEKEVNLHGPWGITYDTKRDVFVCTIEQGCFDFPGLVQVDNEKSRILSLSKFVPSFMLKKKHLMLDITYTDNEDCYIIMFSTGMIQFLNPDTDNHLVCIRKFTVYPELDGRKLKWETPTIIVSKTTNGEEELHVKDFQMGKGKVTSLIIDMKGIVVDRHVVDSSGEADTQRYEAEKNWSCKDDSYKSNITWSKEGRTSKNSTRLQIRQISTDSWVSFAYDFKIKVSV